MSLQFNVLVVPSLLAAGICAVLAIVAGRRTSTRGARSFSVTMVLFATSSLTSAGVIASTTLDSSLGASMIGTVALVFQPIAIFAFAASYTNLNRRIARPVILAGVVVATIYLVLVIADRLAGTALITRAVEFDASAGYGAVVRTRGPLFTPFIMSLSSLTLWANLLLLRAALIAPHLYRRQAATMLIGALIPSFVIVAQFAGFAPIRGFDMTGFGGMLSGLVMGWALLSYRTFDLTPPEQVRLRATIVAGMRDGVVVLDRLGRVLDLNGPAELILSTSIGKAIGTPIDSLSPSIAAVVAESDEDDPVVGIGEHQYEVRASSVTDWQGEPAGRLLVLNDVTERQRLHAELLRLAFSDALTGLANRARLTDELNARVTARQPFAVLFIDLDSFKTINDSLGHAEGDILLTAVSRRLLSCLGPRDVLARFGGDEFVVLLDGVEIAGVLAIADDLLVALRPPFRLGQRDMPMTASIGIATRANGSSADDLLRAADTAMYAAKDAGRDRAIVYDDLMHERANRRLTLGADLAQSLANDALSTTLDAGRRPTITWRHTSHGIISFDEIVAIAEDRGQVSVLSEWIALQACRLAATGDGVVLPRAVAALPDIEQTIRVAAASAGIDAARIRFDDGESDPPPTASLTPREQEVADLVARGLSNQEIARTLVVSTSTVSFHLRQIFAKTGLHSRAQVAIWILQQRARSVRSPFSL